MLAGAFGLFLWEQERGASLAQARTTAVNVIVMVLVFYLFNCRSLTRSMFSVGVFSNWWTIAGVAGMIGLQLAIHLRPAPEPPAPHRATARGLVAVDCGRGFCRVRGGRGGEMDSRSAGRGPGGQGSFPESETFKPAEVRMRIICGTDFTESARRAATVAARRATRGCSRWSAALSGSVTQAVISRSVRPLLVVHGEPE